MVIKIPVKTEALTQAARPERRLGLSQQDVQTVVDAVFPQGTPFTRLSDSLVGEGRASPKAPIRAKDQPLLVRELAFYVSDPHRYGKFATDFQSWLAERGMTPELLPRTDGKGALIPLGEKGERVAYLQRLVSGATSLAGSDRAQAGFYGALVRKFHDLGREYRRARPDTLPPGMDAKSFDRRERLYGFVESEFAASHPDVTEQRQFSKLVQQSRANGAALAKRQPEATQTPPTLLHGDFNPGNVLLADGKPLIIDFDNLRYGHPSADIALTLSSMLVTRHFESHGPGRTIPAALSSENLRAGAAFLRGYLDGMPPRQAIEVLEQLRYELPWVLEQDLLFGFVDGHMGAAQLADAWPRIQSLEASFDSLFSSVKDSLRANAPSKADAFDPSARKPSSMI